MKNNHEQNLQINVIVRYGLVGLLGTTIHFGSLILLVEFANFDPVLGSALGFLLVLVISYILNRTWTFQSKSRNLRQFLIYSIVSLIGLGLNSTIIFISVHLLKWNYLYGQCLVVLVVPVSNYLLNSLWTFRD
ncbi:GtrA family protein [Clostridium estertheticum]|uniref:GtrA family protein n=1 Tax=Clostridium estertheticum TaxID=238834 RepID=UPI001CF49E92|nr:GtrA family protein [Clostridium estertheticum]MCB2354969.1 GtrA family protein [Clostridium estertheticum]WAG41922.1 GtrA family protein [Clostridium estertheticum]